jgi:hypothetical protein
MSLSRWGRDGRASAHIILESTPAKVIWGEVTPPKATEFYFGPQVFSFVVSVPTKKFVKILDYEPSIAHIPGQVGRSFAFSEIEFLDSTKIEENK